MTNTCRSITVLGLLASSFALAALAEESSEWLSHVQADIVASEYHLSQLGTEWQAPNRANGFRTYFTGSGIRVTPRTEASPTWTWALEWIGYGRGTHDWPVPRAALDVKETRIDYRRGAISEWYENSPRGLKQGFVLTRPPEELGGERANTAEGPVRLDLAIAGDLRPVFSEDRLAIDFEAPRGDRVLHYAELIVKDSTGRDVPAWFEGFADAGVRGLRIVIDDSEAVYPITVDPLSTWPTWTSEGNQDYAYFGTTVATAGDVNGDGFSDVVVSSYQYDNGESDEGRVFVYHGAPFGLSALPAWTAESNQVGAYFGRSVATAGDVNGDGYSDLIVGAHYFDNGETNEGRTFLYLGSAAGLNAAASWTAESNQVSAGFGISVASAGDANSDGYSDVVVGAYNFSNGETQEGRAFLYLGSAAGLRSTAAWSAESDQAMAQFGWSVSTAGDVNGDGYSDVIVGAHNYTCGAKNEGAAFLFLGSPAGLQPSRSWVACGDAKSADFGHSVSTAGDVNGDGYSDVIVGAPNYSDSFVSGGRAVVFSGSSSGLETTHSWSVSGWEASAEFGASVSTVGDVNGDGYADVAVGVPLDDGDIVDEGSAFVYFGSAAGLSNASWSGSGDQVGARYGASVAGAGDVNGDGYSDVLVGAWGFENGNLKEGRAFLYVGSASPSLQLLWTSFSDKSLAHLGFSVAGIGDVNGDDLGDFAVGAPWYDNGWGYDGAVFVYYGNTYGNISWPPSWRAEGEEYQAYLGQSVAAAGDVNGDGYGDLVVGSPFYGGQHRGRVLVFHGSSTGLDAGYTRPVGSPSNADWRLDGNGQLGYSVAGAGDVNGDGYSDIVFTRIGTGAGFYPTAFVYYGSRFGITHGGVFPTHYIGTAEGYGSSISSAGDVNGDGYSDVIVGAPHTGYIYLGAAYVYLGSNAGLSGNYAWRADGVGNYGKLGSAVATAGDVNGDGYSDVVVGAPGDADSTSGGQGAYAWYGSATGLGANGTPSNADWHGWDENYSSRFGHSVATAGDVNNDGYSDVVVGIPLSDELLSDAGQIRVYLGSGSGLSNTVGWSANPVNGNGAPQLGTSVACAGDFNGDGYADVIAGAPFEDGGSAADYGRVYVWLGNDTPAAARTTSPRVRQGKENFDRPISPLGKVDGYYNRFKIVSTGRTPFGRGGVKFQWEIKPRGTRLDGTQLHQSLAWRNPLGGDRWFEFADTSPTIRDHHWRVRVLYQSVNTPLQGHGRWITVPTNGWQETDLRAFGCEDADGDGYGSYSSSECVHPDGNDCNDRDVTAWEIPGEVRDLTLRADHQTLNWAAPSSMGGTAVVYDSLRSHEKSDFTAAAICVESDDGSNLWSVDTGKPTGGGVFYYLVRAGNSCGDGSSGATSSGTPRVARACP